MMLIKYSNLDQFSYKKDLLHTFQLKLKVFWTFKGPCVSQKAQNWFQKGLIHCWVISTDIWTLIWRSVNTKGTLLHRFKAQIKTKNYFLVKIAIYIYIHIYIYVENIKDALCINRKFATKFWQQQSYWSALRVVTCRVAPQKWPPNLARAKTQVLP